MFNASRSMEFVKRGVRLMDARFSSRTVRAVVHGTPLTLIQPRFWDATPPHLVEVEINPYFEAFTSPIAPTGVIVDAGAATGQFAIAWALQHPSNTIHAFEPSQRQRILLTRNARLNGVERQLHVHPSGLWNQNTTLAFRTHGDISSVEGATQIPPGFLFTERIKAVRLDDWAEQSRLSRLDLIKMDIEGAEIEALRGAERALKQFRPHLLVQAYHLRDGKRTLEACADWLTALGYQCREWNDTGLLHAAPLD